MKRKGCYIGAMEKRSDGEVEIAGKSGRKSRELEDLYSGCILGDGEIV